MIKVNFLPHDESLLTMTVEHIFILLFGHIYRKYTIKEHGLVRVQV